MAVELATQEVTQLICDQVESALRERGLLMRPIPFFDRLDRFRTREAELVQIYERYLVHFNETTAHRALRSCAFADELTWDVLRNFNPSLPEEGEEAQRTIWGAAVVIDQLLDEEGVEAAYLALVLKRVAEQARAGSCPEKGRFHDAIPGANTLAAMLADALADCRQRAVDADAYAVFNANLARMLDAELASLSATLDSPPVESVRAILRDKSVLLSWVGFQGCALGQRLDLTQVRDYQGICDAIGETLWIMDDLMDLEEDLDRGIWNRTLWRLYDDVGKVRFRNMSGSMAQLAEEITSHGIVVREIDEIAKLLNFIETHPRIQNAEKVRAMMSFWLTAWLGIYR